MRSGTLEKIRLLEADLELCRGSVVQQLLLPVTNPRHQILRDHFIVQQAKVAHGLADKLLDVYLDESDIEKVRNELTEEDDVLDALRDFDASTAELRERHKKYPDFNPIERRFATPDPALLEHVFHVHEYYGAYLDLQVHYDTYRSVIVQSRLSSAATDASSPVDYAKFTTALSTLLLTGIPSTQKIAAFPHYKAFVSAMLEYLADFYRRVKPLDHAAFQSDLDSASSGYREFVNVVQKQGLAPTRLRRFEKQYAVWSLESAASEGISADAVHQVATQEAQIAKVLLSSLDSVYQATVKRMVRSAAMTPEEALRERAEEDSAFLASLAAAERHVAGMGIVSHVAKAELLNPSAAFGAPSPAAITNDSNDQNDDNEPEFVGKDGNELPKWLVKIMQLKKKFRCEVCGGEVFKGMKTYKDHFALERHTEGLRQLGVPYEQAHNFAGLNDMTDVLHFRDILARHFDAVNLRKRVREDAENEETQDINGNIMTSKSFSAFQGNRHMI